MLAIWHQVSSGDLDLGSYMSIYGSYMGRTWYILVIYESYMLYMGHIWVIYWSYMGHIWYIYGSFLGHNYRTTYGSYMVYMGHIWAIYGIDGSYMGHI